MRLLTFFFLTFVALTLCQDKDKDKGLIVVTSNGLILNARIDPIVSPGGCSGHVHSIFGATSFRETVRMTDITNPQTPTSSNVKFTKSMYWIPSMYIRNPKDNMFYIVPSWARIYYDTTTSRNKVNPFPLNLRALIGNPLRRSFWSGAQERDHVKWTRRTINRKDTTYLKNGDWSYLRREGVTDNNLDELELNIAVPECLAVRRGVPVTSSPDFRSHMAYAVNRVCPPSHPYTIPQIRFEGRYRLDPMREQLGSDIVNNINNWVLSNGDTTGASGHLDILEGWPTDLMGKMITNCNEGLVLANNCPTEQFYKDTTKSQRDNGAMEYKVPAGLIQMVPDEEVAVVAKLPSSADGCRLVARAAPDHTISAAIGENSESEGQSSATTVNNYAVIVVVGSVLGLVVIAAAVVVIVRAKFAPKEEHV